MKLLEFLRPNKDKGFQSARRRSYKREHSFTVDPEPQSLNGDDLSLMGDQIYKDALISVLGAQINCHALKELKCMRAPLFLTFTRTTPALHPLAENWPIRMQLGTLPGQIWGMPYSTTVAFRPGYSVVLGNTKVFLSRSQRSCLMTLYVHPHSAVCQKEGASQAKTNFHDYCLD
ncbi:hypothetical protein T4E_4527 [Trichinella pseudospiralis]|uniref:Uncharacterized protein n=1 Tax=Trichinella pseudospiralis TaxID=6337 RepID=A0A0V0XKV6_TRIPS|nr:hypothetical protein T4E_4527 [Trichinella pseudospiralis]